MPKRSVKYVLPPKFNNQERAAYQWLDDCQIRGWLVDMKDKSVRTDGGKFASLVELARHHGWRG